ncbi:MAG: S8 family serine peptidase [Eggerthellaceae bacterium]|nr:S8 family serine peptidase [Eggerthellaceae bacterium]
MRTARHRRGRARVARAAAGFLALLLAWGMAVPGIAAAENLPADDRGINGVPVEGEPSPEGPDPDVSDDLPDESTSTESPTGGSAEALGQTDSNVSDFQALESKESGSRAPNDGAPPGSGSEEATGPPAAPDPETPRGLLVAVIDTGCDASLCERAVSVVGGSPDDTSGHGTSVAQMVLGQNPDARILSIKALDDEGRGSAEAVCAALREAIDGGADIINMSFSTYAPEGQPAIEALVEEALGKGIAVVAAAGNDGGDASQFCPAQVDGAITVGAADLEGEPLPSSNAGEAVDVWITASSTSYAAAIVSGRLSLMGAPSAASWLDALIAYGDVWLICTSPVESGGELGDFAAAFTHAVITSRVHISHIGDSKWMTTNENYPIATPNATLTTTSYGAHPQNNLWSQIENIAFKVTLNNAASGGITYRVYYRTKGYDSWRSNGTYSPTTTGAGLSVEGLEAKLTGTLASCYDLFYKVYTSAQTETDQTVVITGANTQYVHKWYQASNGGYAGTKSKSVAIEAYRMWLVPKSYTHTVQVRYQNADGTYGGWSNARSGSYAYGSAVPAWSRAADGTYNAGSMAAYTAGYTAETRQVSISRTSYYLDVNGMLDGQADGGCGSMGTFDFNVNGSNVANDVADYYQTSLAGSTWSITDIKAKPGYTYEGAAEGATSGTLGTASAQAARLSFHTNTYTVSFDGNGADGGTMDGQSMSCHSSSTLHTCAFERAGYSFTGWNTEPDGSGASFEDGEPVTNLTLQDKATVTLYAQWKQNLYLPATGSKTLTNSILSFFLYTAPAILVTKRTNRKPKRLSRKP